MNESLRPAGAPALDVRAQVAAAIRDRRASLVADIAGALLEAPAALDPRAWKRSAEAVLDGLAAVMEADELEPRAPVFNELHHLTTDALGIDRLFDAVYMAERTVLDELALDEHLGATSEPWPAVAQLVRRTSFRLLSALSRRFGAGVPAGLVRDPLTTLLVRPVFDAALEQEVHRAERFRHPLSVILLDIDNLSGINAEHGYGFGDRLLERMGILLRRFFRQHDWVARHDKDSIVALLPETTLDDAALLAERVRRTVEERLVSVDHKTGVRVAVTLSAAAVGTDLVETVLDPYQIMAELEDAVRRAKTGRTRVERVALQPASVSLLGAASLLECPPGEIRRLIRDKLVDAQRRGRHVHVDRGSVERYRTELLAKHRD